MRRITSREKFFTLVLRDDGGLIAQSRSLADVAATTPVANAPGSPKT